MHRRALSGRGDAVCWNKLHAGASEGESRVSVGGTGTPDPEDRGGSMSTPTENSATCREAIYAGYIRILREWGMWRK